MTYNVTFIFGASNGSLQKLFKNMAAIHTGAVNQQPSCSTYLEHFIGKGKLEKISHRMVWKVAYRLSIESPAYVSRGDISSLAPSTKSRFFEGGPGINKIVVTSDKDPNSLLITKGGVSETLRWPRLMIGDYPSVINYSFAEKLHGGMTVASGFVSRLKAHGRSSLLRRFL